MVHHAVSAVVADERRQFLAQVLDLSRQQLRLGRVLLGARLRVEQMFSIDTEV